jgi:NADH-quinone oxidoreductase subunit E
MDRLWDAQETEEIRREVREILLSVEGKRENLIPILQRIQADLDHVPQQAMVELAECLHIPVGEIYGVVTFYNQFRLKPLGKYRVKVCMGTACHVKRSYIIMEEWKRRLGIQEGDTTEDRIFSLERVACVGCCALAPVTVVGSNGVETFYGRTMTSKVSGLMMEFQRREGGEGGK